MLVNRTLEYKKFTKRKDVRFNPLSTSGLRVFLEDVRKSICRLGIVQEKHCMPSFSPKRKKKEEIEDIKRCIVEHIHNAEKNIEGIREISPSKTLTECMYGYFVGQLKSIVHDYRGLQQKFLKNIDIYEEIEEEDEENEGSRMLLENVKDLRKSIYDLTSVLLDMKMAVGQQTLQIDRLDFYLESVNFYLEGANCELEKIPASHRRMKDKIMYFMLLLSVVLVLMSILKVARRK
ncbi:t-SNARE complex syntaxin [Encephalitozoon intestinalis ATCC 50506]|uniref:t-SNARE complex syntaxin n=1 Tax=Encephalitozoon intestinalis (strain ATCC 50506) TaxID=876142 RepID=E0S6Y8_ENCIT|nr:t-SNARE complex syntaxin [Encephalitozoon intestinalis ATCC 50506]ADM11574.1 t-SNARE complex syntaxin [Encephalitozoon intestinalis ATCC 50506]UTX45291.1 hypothetical protein GPK93_05g08370 [Encephalitozoon intestinalis]